MSLEHTIQSHQTEIREMLKDHSMGEVEVIDLALEVGLSLITENQSPLHLADAFKNEKIDTTGLLEAADKISHIQKKENQSRMAKEDEKLQEMARRLGRLEVKTGEHR